MNKHIYVLHEHGAPSHYNALVSLANKNGYKVTMGVFTIRGILAAFYHRRYKSAFISIYTMLTLPFKHDQKIVLGIAPFNKYLPWLCRALQNHELYYHTSFTSWNGSNMAQPTKSEHLKNKWKRFTNNVSQIFAVSNKTKEELITHGYSDGTNISVVNHSYSSIIKATPKYKDNSFIYVGRLVKCKGISELLEIFARYSEATLTIAGSGDLEDIVKSYAERYTNINYIGFINGLNNLIPIYSSHSFLIMNSKRVGSWEELFGISIIESMACGCVPITTDHPGPKEIIIDNLSGFISKEGEIELSINKAIELPNSMYQELRAAAIATGEEYQSDKIASRWRAIL